MNRSNMLDNEIIEKNKTYWNDHADLVLHQGEEAVTTVRKERQRK